MFTEEDELNNLESQELDENTPPPDDPPPEEDDDNVTYSRRVQKRINKLSYEIKSRDARLQKMEAELQAMRQAQQQEAEHRQTQTNSQKINDLISRKKDALEVSDWDEVVKVDNELLELKTQDKKPEPSPKAPDPVQPSMSSAEQEWANKNAWIYDTKQEARYQKAVKVFEELLNEGYDRDDPETFIELDKKIKRQVPPPSGGVDRGQVTGASHNKSFTKEDLKEMARWGIEDTPKARAEWVKNKGV